MLGGLLSAHQLIVRNETLTKLIPYNGEFLALAYDLGLRLLPAFKTPTGIPRPRVTSDKLTQLKKFAGQSKER